MNFRRSIKHLWEILKIDKDYRDINALAELVIPVLDALGTSALEEAAHVVFKGWDGAATDALIESGSVPWNKLWFVPFATAFHDDTVARSIGLSLRPLNAPTSWVWIRDRTSLTALDSVSSSRAFLMPPMSVLGANCATALAAGKKVYLRAVVYEIPVGEYVIWPN